MNEGDEYNHVRFLLLFVILETGSNLCSFMFVKVKASVEDFGVTQGCYA
jgi:hypothetical protein